VKKRVIVLLIILAVFASYAPALRNGFVWDDTALILRDPLIRSWRLIPEGFNHYLFTDATASNFYRPVQRLTYTLDYSFAAFRPALYHLTSLLCHAAAAVAWFVLAEELLCLFGVESRKRRVISFFAALIWAVHPVQNAAIVYISGRADPLAALFGFLGFFFVLRSAYPDCKKRLLYLTAATLLFLLSGLSKESGLVFPLLAVLALGLHKNWGAMFNSAVIAICVAIVYASLRLPAEHLPVPAGRAPAPALVRPILVMRSVAEYAGLLALPLNLHMDRDVETNPHGFEKTSVTMAARRELQTLLGIVLVALLIYWIVRARRKSRPVFALLLLTILAYLPVSGILALNATVAEHWLYLPTAFLFLAASTQCAEFFPGRKSTIQVATAALLACWLVFLAVRTFVRTSDWKDQRTFVEHTIANGGDSTRMLINLAGVELSQGKLTDASLHLHEALRKSPDEPLAIINLASVAIRQRDFNLAHQLLDRAITMPAIAAQAHELLAVAAYKENGTVDLMRLRLASRTGSPNWTIEKRYVEALNESGATREAIIELENCLRTEWYRAETWQLLSRLLAKSGRTNDAAVALSRARAYDVHLNEVTSH
jgi:tetratricopeptide (TPR) repeat protein